MEKNLTGIVYFVIATSGFLIILIGLVVNLLLVGRNRRLKHLNDVLEIKSNYEKELMKTQVEVAENTLNDISRDLHDDIGQMLTFCIISLNRVDSTQQPAIAQSITDVRSGLQQTLQSVRSIAKSLNHDYITSFGIYESVQRMFERIEKQGIITPHFNFQKNLLFKSKPTELFAFRIIQELTNNTLKYAEATEIHLTLVEEKDMLMLKYADNGKGFDSALVLQKDNLKQSLGFTTIYKRAELINGKISLASEPGKGFTFDLTFSNS